MEIPVIEVTEPVITNIKAADGSVLVIRNELSPYKYIESEERILRNRCVNLLLKACAVLLMSVVLIIFPLQNEVPSFLYKVHNALSLVSLFASIGISLLCYFEIKIYKEFVKNKHNLPPDMDKSLAEYFLEDEFPYFTTKFLLLDLPQCRLLDYSVDREDSILEIRYIRPNGDYRERVINAQITENVYQKDTVITVSESGIEITIHKELPEIHEE